MEKVKIDWDKFYYYPWKHEGLGVKLVNLLIDIGWFIKINIIGIIGLVICGYIFYYGAFVLRISGPDLIWVFFISAFIGVVSISYSVRNGHGV